MNHFQFLSVTNKHFIPIVKDLLESSSKFHPNIPFNLVCVNLSPEEIDYLNSLHHKLQLIIVNKKFKKVFSTLPRHLGPKDKDHEEGYCTSCRSWFALEVMEKYNTNVFYLDADVFFKDKIDGLFPHLSGVDFMIRAKNEDRHEFTCNAGMVFVKNSSLNKKLLASWAQKTREMGISWRSNQWTLNEIIRENWDDIVYKNFPLEFNGISTNEKSIICHNKGKGAHPGS